MKKTLEITPHLKVGRILLKAVRAAAAPATLDADANDRALAKYDDLVRALGNEVVRLALREGWSK